MTEKRPVPPLAKPRPPKLPVVAEMKEIDGMPAAYICENFACQAPVTAPATLRELLLA